MQQQEWKTEIIIVVPQRSQRDGTRENEHMQQDDWKNKAGKGRKTGIEGRQEGGKVPGYKYAVIQETQRDGTLEKEHM